MIPSSRAEELPRGGDISCELHWIQQFCVVDQGVPLDCATTLKCGLHSGVRLEPHAPHRLRLHFAALGAAGFGVGGTGAVVGFLEQTMRLGHGNDPFEVLTLLF
jgi:hypothetical protein